MTGTGEPPKNVLHVVWEYPPVIYGGLARHAEQLAKAQHDAGLAVGVLTAAEDVTDPRRRIQAASTTRRGITVHRVRRAAPRTPWTNLTRAAAELAAAFFAAGMDAASDSRPDVVHGHDWTAFNGARAISDAVGVPLVMTIHATEHGRRTGNLTPEDERGVPARIDRIERESVRAADAVIVCSEAMRREVVEVLGAEPERVSVVPNAVAASAWRTGPGAVRAARNHWTGNGSDNPGRPDLLVAAAGRIEWEKGFSTLVRALPALREAAGSVHVVLAGRGSEVPRLQNLAAELGVERQLRFPGWLTRRDLAALYAAADAVVVPSRYEPSGLVVREAQAAGASVVATNVGGIPETVRHGETGLLIDVGDVHALRDAVLRLAADPAGARTMGRAAATAVRGRTWTHVGDETSAVYQAAAARKQKPAPHLVS